MSQLLDPSYLLASLIWGSIGTGFFIYGSRQKAPLPAVAGILIITTSYCASSPLMMSAVCMALIVAFYLLHRRGF